jgi:uncharacterized protein (TIGR02246 family)
MKRIASFFFASLFATAFLFAQTAEDEAGIRANVATMARGWCQADGQLFASVFAPVSDYIVWNGYYMPGASREGIARAHDGLFRGVYANTDLYLVVDKVTFPAPGVGLVHVYGAVVGDGEARPADPAVLMTILFAKNGEGWQAVSFHNLDLEVYQNEEIRERAPMPAGVMYKGWYDQSGK